jgi:hypothetical protein
MLELSYTLCGDIGALRVPARSDGARTDSLWRATCFEAFILPTPGEAYLELNLSPSTSWAAYAFSRHRTDMCEAYAVPPPTLEVETGPETLTLFARLDLSVAPAVVAGAPWRLGLTAVVQGGGGEISYWALAHPAGRPEFHDAATWTAELAAGGAL